jgi:hypothetical protein
MEVTQSEMIVTLARELKLTCSTKREIGTCTPSDCENCLTRDLVSAAYRMADGECEKSKPACRAVSEQQAGGEESAELNSELCALLDDFDAVRVARDAAEERVKQFAQALRSVCIELLLERGCYEGECGTDACSYRDCVVGPALKLLDKLEEDTRREST